MHRGDQRCGEFKHLGTDAVHMTVATEGTVVIVAKASFVLDDRPRWAGLHHDLAV